MSDVEDFEIEVAGRLYFLRPSLELARRIEEAVGPIAPFALRLERGAVTADEMTRFYAACLEDQPERPEADKIKHWAVIERGLYGHMAAAWFAASLIVGTDNLRAYRNHRGSVSDSLAVVDEARRRAKANGRAAI